MRRQRSEAETEKDLAAYAARHGMKEVEEIEKTSMVDMAAR